jgi:hypothetical protein
VVVVNHASARWLEVADDVDVCLWARLRLVPVAPEMNRFDGFGSLGLHKEDLIKSVPVFERGSGISTFSGHSRPRSSE